MTGLSHTLVSFVRRLCTEKPVSGRHVDVEQDEVRLVLPRHLDGLVGILGDQDLVAGVFQSDGKRSE